jgi:hypothetical protein
LKCILAALALIALLVPLAAQAKRVPPPKVEPVVHDGVKYVAPNDEGRRGYIQAWDTNANKMLWEVTVFRNTINPALEEDVQWVFIKELKIEAGKLIVVSERNRAYSVDLKTRAVKALDTPPAKKSHTTPRSAALAGTELRRDECSLAPA